MQDAGITHLVTHEPKRAAAATLAAAHGVTRVIGLAPGDDLSAEALSWADVPAGASPAPEIVSARTTWPM